MFNFDPDVIHRAGINRQTADAHFRLTTTRQDQPLVEHDLPFDILELQTGIGPNTCFILDMTTTPDDFSIRAVSKILADSGTEKREVTQILQNFLQHQATDVFRDQTAKTEGQAIVEYT